MEGWCAFVVCVVEVVTKEDVLHPYSAIKRCARFQCDVTFKFCFRKSSGTISGARSGALRIHIAKSQIN